ncbi:E3 ubiquitin-protein ligase RNF181 [Thecamonas trahens ATCC 50062]|uniref:E3 ubiquitin-protein ligase RNF181 n=1 Tax=Thecamonas trahens ATCC 50062 TaxID=461836 RepID=A0A0L0DKE7_THETB|nr:E3 ubiquitin-protein ligase RNF181 [Thecamonas trahens ATCC 50062]KNC52879.1 E3 ubiquitin-protein ligase RNF181 [Thecamonas trahens ATCC 50062]|eukprot:XP_013754978.1 E3 ubiquitin-protein ligase RNF181 [Thecamonas trahens ATCC 50062]
MADGVDAASLERLVREGGDAGNGSRVGGGGGGSAGDIPDWVGQRTPPTARYYLDELEESVFQLRASHVRKHKEPCMICMETFAVGDEALRLPCNHLYHSMCLMPWLYEHSTCALCRYQLPTLDVDFEAYRRAHPQPDPHNPRDITGTSLMYM